MLHFFFSTATEIVINAGRKQCKAHLQILKMHFADLLTKIRQNLTTLKLISQEESSKNLNELLNSMLVTIVEKIKGVLQDLVVRFLQIFLYYFFSLLYNFGILGIYST